MSITVELTYDMAKVLGLRRLELEGVVTVADVVRQTRERFGAQQEVFDRLTRVTALVVNGVLVNHHQNLETRLVTGDQVAFLKAAAGG